jgi:hypothetical protein
MFLESKHIDGYGIRNNTNSGVMLPLIELKSRNLCPSHIIHLIGIKYIHIINLQPFVDQEKVEKPNL